MDFPRELLSDLRCPYCGSALRCAIELAGSSNGIRDAVLRCDCYEYPVAGGIAVVRQMSPASSTENLAVERLRGGDVDGALQWLLVTGSAPGVPCRNRSSTDDETSAVLGKLRRIWTRKCNGSERDRFPEHDSFEAALRSSRSAGYAEYLFQRFANPSFLGAIPPLIVLGDACSTGLRRRLLDLLCGVGHSSALLRALCPDANVVMADFDFVNLFIARRFLAPDAPALCLDAELPLPFSDGSIDAAFCLDGLHYVRSKTVLLRELDRVISRDGAWVFAHLHNACRTNLNPGVPLEPSGYMQRFAFGQQRVVPEMQVLRHFQEEGSFDLTQQACAGALSASDALTLVGARNDRLWMRYSGLDQALSRRPELLALNPLYRIERDAHRVRATALWRSAALRRECVGATPLIEETVELSCHTLQEIAAAYRGGSVPDNLQELLRKFVIVPLPPAYPRIAF